MDSKKRVCKCPPKLQQVCKHAKIVECKDIAEIIEALTDQDKSSQKIRKIRQPHFKTKPFKPHHYKDTCIPMAPSMHTRLRYIGHCSREPPRRTGLGGTDLKSRQMYSGLDVESSSEEETGGILRKDREKDKKKKKVRYFDLLPGDITFTVPPPVIKHTASDKSIFNVPSPKTSGEVIQAQKAAVKPGENKPPLPPKSGYDLFKPHSGIIVNKEKYFAPDAVFMPGPRKILSDKDKPCHRGGFSSEVPYTNIGVTDGKPRARGTQKHIKDDDSVCGVDEIPRPEHVQIPANLKRGTLQTHSLTVLPCTKERRQEIHYGILTGSFNMYDAKFSARSKGRQALTMSVMAYCLAFHYHPKQWTMKLVDNLVDAGDQWVFKVVIWKDKICYYIFDPAGRDSRAYSNFTNGCAALINVKDLNSVAEVLLARSIVEDQKFVLASLKVLKMVDETCDEDFDSDKELTQAEKAVMGYRILNENCAIVNANMHLGDRCFEDAQYRQALPIAIVAMTYAKISPPNTWFSKTLDKVLRLGNKLYMDCLHPKVMIDMTIDNIPNEIIVGPYACEIIIYRERVKGQLFTTKECLLNILTGLEEFFSHEYNSGILEFNNYMLAVWRQKDMFYLFDPYPRTYDGLRSFKAGKACCLMLLNSDTVAAVFTKNWDYLPATTQFYIHAFKVLKLKKKEPKAQIVCTLSDEQLPGSKKIKRQILSMSRAKGDAKELYHDVFAMEDFEQPASGPQMDEEQMGDIISLVDSIQEDYLPPIPLRYKNLPPEAFEEKIVNLDSPTVSVTQVVPPWPRVRDKAREPPEPDPDPEPTPPPTPPSLPPPEDGAEEEEEGEEEEDEESAKRKKEELERKKAEEEDARRKAEELPPPLPPPPSPQPEPEVPLAQPEQIIEEEVQTLPPVNVKREILLAEDAQYRFKLRHLRKKMTTPLIETNLELTAEEELAKPNNFKNLPDNTQIIRGASAITEKTIDVLPFAAIMAVVTSYKYTVNTWTEGIVNFVVETAKKLYENKLGKFQFAPVHIIPKIAIGHQAYHAKIDVVEEGATWQLENILGRKFLVKHDRGMITTATYSCAFFKRNNLYYLYDASSCNAMGMREANGKGKACFMRFHTLHDLVARVQYNRDGKGDQQFILSRIVVRRLLIEPRMKLPEDYDFETGMPKSNKSKFSLAESSPKTSEKKKSSVETPEVKSETVVGYQQFGGVYRIEGTTSLKDRSSGASTIKDRKDGTEGKNVKNAKDGKESNDGQDIKGGKGGSVKPCHFVSLITMLMATMHPIRTWDHEMVDICIEKGLEIYSKATNLSVCEKRVIKNVILDGKFVNVNIKKLIVVNENKVKRLEQYLKAVLQKLRFVIIKFNSCSMVICQTDGYYHLFDPYPPPLDSESKAKTKRGSESSVPSQKKVGDVAGWTLYRSLDSLANRIKKVVKEPNSPEFYTFELTSIKTAPLHSALNYRLSPLFKPDDNPNLPYMKQKRIRPIVDEKMYWLKIESVPWSRLNVVNDLGFERKTPKTMWRDWDIEFPGDLYSLWGSLHPLDSKFDEAYRGKQYLATCVIALVMTKACNLNAWTSSLLDGIVESGNIYHEKCHEKIVGSKNHEITLDDLNTTFDVYPFSFTVKFDKIIFGFVYNIYPDRFNLSKALVYFFEQNSMGILMSPAKNLAFGKIGSSYFMFDCQTYGTPIFSPGQGASYILKCESLNRLIYCMAVTLNIRRHGQQFHLFSVNITLTEKTK
ncbi:unnamed protein product, partial [Brenthis ino]